MYVKSNRSNRRSFDTVMEWIHARTNSGRSYQLCNAITRDKAPEVFSGSGGWLVEGLPVVTPILGSGCVWAGRDDRRLPNSIAVAVGAAIDEGLGQGRASDASDPGPAGWLSGTADGSVAPADLLDIRGGVSEFCRELTIDRLGLRGGRADPAGAGSADPWPLESAALSVTIATWALTRWYRLAQARVCLPFPRRDVACLHQLKVSPQDRAVAEALAELAVSALDRAKKDLADGGDVAALPQGVIRFITKLESGARDLAAGRSDSTASIDVQDLRALTELAWYHLAGQRIGIVGWSDLLFSVARRDSSESLHLRPLVQSTAQLAKDLKELLLPSVEESWTTRISAASEAITGAVARLQFFDTVARVVRAESQLEWMTQLPGVCFVTSFDLELPFALAAAAAPDEPAAYLVVPVHAKRRGQDRGKLVWLRATLRRADGSSSDESVSKSSQVVTPFVWSDNDDRSIIDGWELVWELASAHAQRGVPYVVHLTGCPLLSLPEVDPDGGTLSQLNDLLPPTPPTGGGLADLVHARPEPVVLEHAVTIDEPLTVQHAQLDALMAVSDEPVSRLPFHLVGDSVDPLATEAPNYRFWVTVGVPLWDASIRIRLLSQLFARRVLATRRASETSSSGIVGIVVGKGVALEGRAAAYWLDFDVVKDDDAASVRGALEHYGIHLDQLLDLTDGQEGPVTVQWPKENETCNLRVQPT